MSKLEINRDKLFTALTKYAKTVLKVYPLYQPHFDCIHVLSVETEKKINESYLHRDHMSTIDIDRIEKIRECKLAKIKPAHVIFCSVETMKEDDGALMYPVIYIDEFIRFYVYEDRIDCNQSPKALAVLEHYNNL